MKSKLTVYAALIAAVIFWSLSFIWYKTALLYFSPEGIITFRLAISAILLFSAGLLFKQIQRLKLKDFKLLFLMTLFEPFAYSLCEANGMTMVSSTLAAVIVATIPLFSPIGAFIFLKERISIPTGIGIVFSIIGVTLVAYQTGSKASGSLLGITLMFGAVVAAIGYAIGLKKLTYRYNPISIVAYQNLLATILVLPIFLLNNKITPQLFSYEALEPIVKLSVFASTIAFILYAYSMKYLTITKINIFINLIPVFTAIAAYFLLHDKFSYINLLGIGITLVGLYISQISSKSETTLSDTI